MPDYSADIPPALRSAYKAMIENGVDPWNARQMLLPPPDEVLRAPSGFTTFGQGPDLAIYGQRGLPSVPPPTGDPVVGGGPTQFAPSMGNYTSGDYYRRYYPGPGSAGTYPQQLAAAHRTQGAQAALPWKQLTPDQQQMWLQLLMNRGSAGMQQNPLMMGQNQMDQQPDPAMGQSMPLGMAQYLMGGGQQPTLAQLLQMYQGQQGQGLPQTLGFPR